MTAIQNDAKPSGDGLGHDEKHIFSSMNADVRRSEEEIDELNASISELAKQLAVLTKRHDDLLEDIRSLRSGMVDVIEGRI